jgi:hypothetical protein
LELQTEKISTKIGSRLVDSKGGYDVGGRRIRDAAQGGRFSPIVWMQVDQTFNVK